MTLDMDHILTVILLLCSSGLQAEEIHKDRDLFRLVGGSSHCSGTLEVKHDGDWKPVYGPVWTAREAAHICRRLDCGPVDTVANKEAPSHTASAWRIDSFCVTFGTDLTNCLKPDSSRKRLEISCHDSVRLVNGTNLCSGRLEVKSNQQWSSVCEDDFDLQDAEVVCRELGCGAPSVLQGALYGEVEAPMWTKEFQCGGNESALLDCRSSGSARNTCSPGKAVGLTCSAPVRLVGGSSRCNGRLEMKHLKEWRPVFEIHWGLKDAALVCRELDCGSAVSIEWRNTSSDRPTWLIRSHCIQSGFTLMDCVNAETSSYNLEITCSDSVRLGNENQCSGRLEVKSNQQWSSVCEDDFDQQDAEVVCRELGCGAPLDFQGALYGEVEAPMWTKEFQCRGNESALLDCRSSDSARNTCSPGKAVGLTCSAPVRLVGGSSRCSGILEMKHDKEWRPVFHRWTKEEPAVLCRELDCGSFVYREWKVSKLSKPVWKMSSDCVHPASNLRDCAKSGFFPATIELTCSEPVRLGGEHFHCNGTVEVKHGDWRPASASDWTLEDAAVFCETLGCGSAVSTGWRKESSVRSVWALTSECVRSGSAVRDCVRPDSDSSILEITCSGRPYRLVEGTSRCSGLLEVKHEEEWRPVFSFDSYREDLAVLCRKLHCGSDASEGWSRSGSFKSTWDLSFKCVRSGSPLNECIKPRSTTSIMELTCSDEQ